MPWVFVSLCALMNACCQDRRGTPGSAATVRAGDGICVVEVPGITISRNQRQPLDGVKSSRCVYHNCGSIPDTRSVYLRGYSSIVISVFCDIIKGIVVSLFCTSLIHA